MTLKMMIPIFRIFDEAKAKEFYITLLDFKLDWEHRFEPSMPLYMQVSKDHIILHLSEHHGDCTPGSATRIEVEDVEKLQKNILSMNYKYCKPGIEITPWQSKECRVTDPFGNRIIFYEWERDDTASEHLVRKGHC